MVKRKEVGNQERLLRLKTEAQRELREGIGRARARIPGSEDHLFKEETQAAGERQIFERCILERQANPEITILKIRNPLTREAM